MTDDNTIARSLHDLGAAAWFGGSLMGAVGLNGAAGEAKDPTERAAISSAGWRRWVPWNAVAIGAHLAGSTLLTTANRRRLVHQQGVSSTAALKTGVTLVSLGVSAYARYVGRRIQVASPFPADSPTSPSGDTPSELARWQRQEQVLQWVVPALTGALVVLGARMGEQQRPNHVLSGLAGGMADRLATVAGDGAERLRHIAPDGVTERLLHAAASIPSPIHSD